MLSFQLCLRLALCLLLGVPHLSVDIHDLSSSARDQHHQRKPTLQEDVQSPSGITPVILTAVQPAHGKLCNDTISSVLPPRGASPAQNTLAIDSNKAGKLPLLHSSQPLSAPPLSRPLRDRENPQLKFCSCSSGTRSAAPGALIHPRRYRTVLTLQLPPTVIIRPAAHSGASDIPARWPGARSNGLRKWLLMTVEPVASMKFTRVID